MPATATTTARIAIPTTHLFRTSTARVRSELVLYLRRAVAHVAARENVLARRRFGLGRLPVLGAAEREEPALLVGLRLGDAPAPLDHAVTPREVALVLLLDLLGRQIVLIALLFLQRLQDVALRRARRQVLDVVRVVGRGVVRV